MKSKSFVRFSKMTRDLSKRKLKCWKQYKKNRSCLNGNIYKSAARDAKQSCFKDIVKMEENVLECGDLKRFYSFVNSKMTSKNEMPPLKDINGTFHEDPKIKANLLQDQFVSVFTTDNGVLPTFEPRTLDFLDKIEISEEKIIRILKKLPNKTSSGPDGIPAIVLKKLAYYIARPLCIIFSTSFSTGVLPPLWLIAKVAAILQEERQ